MTTKVTKVKGSTVKGLHLLRAQAVSVRLETMVQTVLYDKRRNKYCIPRAFRLLETTVHHIIHHDMPVHTMIRKST